jgi:hypothetical protein
MKLDGAKWQGEPTEARRVRAVIADAPQFPSYWARDLVGTEAWVVEFVVPAYRVPFKVPKWITREGRRKKVWLTEYVEYPPETRYFYDEDGTGTRKLVEMGGSPLVGSRTVEVSAIL